mgnify:CR=1
MPYHYLIFNKRLLLDIVSYFIIPVCGLFYKHSFKILDTIIFSGSFDPAIACARS